MLVLPPGLIVGVRISPQALPWSIQDCTLDFLYETINLNKVREISENIDQEPTGFCFL